MAIGLQDVDGLKTSDYLLDTAKAHIEGKISISDADRRIQGYYEEHLCRNETEEGTKEADIVSVRIAKVLGETIEEAVAHIARFTSGIWQIHPFCEGNTRAAAVFIIKYLKTFGFNISNDTFADNSWYFRNALVRANYNNWENDIHETTKYLELFFENLLMNKHHELKNNPSITQKELALRIGKSERTIKSRTVELQEKGCLKRENGKRNGKWGEGVTYENN